MHRITIALLAITTCVFLPACGGDDTAPSASAPLVFSAQLFPANEVPAITGTESTGHGAVQVQFNVTRDASGAITAATATFYFQLTGYPAGTTIQGAHIHPAPAGVNGPVIISTGLTATNTVTLPSGAGAFAQAVAKLGLLTHLESLMKGVIDLKDVVFYLSFITFGLFLAHQSVESQRWRA
jgi:hypothetical protein